MTDVWEYIRDSGKPVVLYGMGNGADKLFAVFNEYGISVCDVFASDGFVRDKVFHGHKIMSYHDICEKYEDCIVVLGFATFRPEALCNIEKISQRYELLAPETPVYGDEIFNSEYYSNHKDEMEKARSILSDDRSKNVFDLLIKYKLSGKPEYLKAAESSRDEALNEIIRPNDENYLDLGAFRGDTVEEFIKHSKSKYKSITAVEPDKKNYLKLSEYAETNEIQNIRLINSAVSDNDMFETFGNDGGRGSCESEHGEKTKTITVDELYSHSDVSYIKADVEGCEKQALAGGKETLKRCKPKLAVAVYHRIDDFFTIPVMIHDTVPDYKIYFRHHPYIPSWETYIYTCV